MGFLTNENLHASTVYPKKYAHGFCFAVLCRGYTLTDFPITIRLTSLALWQSNDCPSASKATLMNMDKYFMWIHYERLHNHNKAKHNKTVCIFLGIYCICRCNYFSLPLMPPWFKSSNEHGIGNHMVSIVSSHVTATLAMEKTHNIRNVVCQWLTPFSFWRDPDILFYISIPQLPYCRAYVCRNESFILWYEWLMTSYSFKYMKLVILVLNLNSILA